MNKPTQKRKSWEGCSHLFVFQILAGVFVVALGIYAVCGIEKENEPDVLVVGAGNAGLSAAVSSALNGAKVLVIEKNEKLGLGTHSDLGLFASSKSPDGNYGPGDSEERHAQDTDRFGAQTGNVSLIKTLSEEAPKTLQWLTSLGMKFAKNPINSSSLWPRCYQPSNSGYLETLFRNAKKQDVVFNFGVTATRIIVADGRVVGVEAFDKKGKVKRYFAGKAVILATGGFGANLELVSSFNPRLKGLETDNEPGADGQMMMNAVADGADLLQPENVQCLPRPPGLLHTQSYLHLDVSRFIYLNQKGNRFVEEDAPRTELLEKFLEQEPGKVFEVGDGKTVQNLPIDIQRDLWRGMEHEIAFKADSLKKLAKKIGVPYSQMQASVSRYNSFVEAKRDLDFNKSENVLTHKIDTPPYWAVQVKMKIHETLGGLKINSKAQVLKKDGKVFPGLYAAGSIAGGIHGLNRLGGNGIGSAIVFGKIAGYEASRETKR